MIRFKSISLTRLSSVATEERSGNGISASTIGTWRAHFCQTTRAYQMDDGARLDSESLGREQRHRLQQQHDELALPAGFRLAKNPRQLRARRRIADTQRSSGRAQI